MLQFAENNSRSRHSNQGFLWALVLSLTFHLVMIFGIYFEAPASQIEQIEVTLVRLPELEKKVVTTLKRPQFVPKSESPEIPPEKETAFLSEHDSSARVEQLKRGLEEQAKDGPVSPQQVASKSQKRQDEVKQTIAISKKIEPKLKLDQGELTKALASIPLLKREENSSEQLSREKSADKPPAADFEKSEITDQLRENKFQQRQAFQREANSSIFSARSGSPDYLPQIQDGDITLLNAKADRHAVFVRRVAAQVFGSLRRKNWQELPFHEIQKIRGFTKVHAVMSPTGRLISVTLEDTSGNKYFDTVVENAAKDGSWDKNPPPSAQASDGNIHFIFQSKTWANRTAEAGNEQRWLLLGTGLL